MPASPHVERLIASQAALRDRVGGTFIAFDPAESVDGLTHAYAIPYLETGDCIAAADAGGRWGLPGGALRPGESWEQALSRELLAGCGIVVQAFLPFGVLLDEQTGGRSIVSVAKVAVDMEAAAADVTGEVMSSVLATSNFVAQSLLRDASPHLAAVYAVAEAVRTVAEAD